MEVSGVGMQSMQQHQYRKGQGQGMGAIMQSLPQEDRQALRDQLQSLSEADRQNVVSQIKELDPTSMSSEELLNSIYSILDQTTQTTTTATPDSTISIYA